MDRSSRFASFGCRYPIGFTTMQSGEELFSMNRPNQIEEIAKESPPTAFPIMNVDAEFYKYEI